MRAAMSMAAPRNLGLGRLFSTSTFNFTPPQPQQPASANPPAEPNPNLFVSGLSKRTTTEGLREAFSKFGEVVQAKVVTDRVSGFSKGYGFVRYATTEEASAGIQGMDGKFLDGWVIFAEYSRPRPPPAQQQPNGYGYTPYNTNGQRWVLTCGFVIKMSEILFLDVPVFVAHWLGLFIKGSYIYLLHQ